MTRTTNSVKKENITRTANSGYGVVRLDDRKGAVGPGEKGVIVATGEGRVAEWLEESLLPCMRCPYVTRRAETESLFYSLVQMPGMAMAFIEVGFFGEAMIGSLDRLRKLRPQLQVVLFTVSDIPLEDLSRYLYWGGGCSFISLRDRPEEVEEHLRGIFRGGKWAPEEMLREMRDYGQLPTVEPHLTYREIEVVRCAAREQKRKEIAYNLKVSEDTVKNHLGNIRLKFGVHNMVGILKLAVTQGILPERELRSCRFGGHASSK